VARKNLSFFNLKKFGMFFAKKRSLRGVFLHFSKLKLNVMFFCVENFCFVEKSKFLL
jgi:hypothetical protein